MSELHTPENIRNIGIIAHVDHGKTTLVDELLKQTGIFRENQDVAERMMDSMDLEREKGITIKSKNAALDWKDCRVNIVDTPGHADFGGEVERILKMVDGVILLVDAAEGPQAQTRFVLRKAIEQNLSLIVAVNKIDREAADAHRAHDLVLELLLELHASEDQFHAPFLYGSARDGYMVHELGDQQDGLVPLFDTIVAHIPPPKVDISKSFQMLVSNLDWSDYVGRIAIGRITSGSILVGDAVFGVHKDGGRSVAKVTRLFTFDGMQSVEVEKVGAGDIIGLAGISEPHIGDTLCATAEGEALPFMAIDPPTISMQFCVNNGPLAGRDGKFVTSRHVWQRLQKEIRTNVSIEVAESEMTNTFEILARGELQVAILVETMRREGFELLISRPEVIYREENGKRLEPYETLWVEVPAETVGDVMQALAARKGRITQMEHHGAHTTLEAIIPTRGIIGLESYLTNVSAGSAVMSHLFKEYGPVSGEIPTRSSGALVAAASGTSTGYALDTIQDRGRLFIGPQVEVYEGMIIGENSRNDDLPVNPTRTKQLTNVRASGTDKSIMLEPPVIMSLERALEWIAPDEFVEATPHFLRLRKRTLDATQRKREKQRLKDVETGA